MLQPAKPIEADHPLRRLADACVRELDEYRAPFDAGEFERRSTGLDGERRRLLSQWGYPHVFDRWRFHMTLSCGIRPTDHERRRSVLDAARTQFADALKCSIECDSLCVFVEGSPGEPFVLSDRFPLGR